MKAVELRAFDGFDGLYLTDVEIPTPAPHQVLIRVEGAGLNFAEIELTKGRYPSAKQLPFVMGFEAAGIVVETGIGVSNIRVGDKVAAVVGSGGFAQYAAADAAACIPIPDGISFPEATTIPIQGLSAYALLEYAARPQPAESMLIQSAAGGVGLFLVQMAKERGIRRVVALAGSEKKIRVVESLGADVVINYALPGWAEEVRTVLGGGADIVLEAASGEVGRESFRLMAPFGRMVMYGAKNIHDTLDPQQLRQLITGNQSLIGFNIPSLRPEQTQACVPKLLRLIAEGRLKLFAQNVFPLEEAKRAFEVLASRETIGKVVVIP
jgi:NADPH2:quinone reductase